MYSRNAPVVLIKSWEGLKESNGTHKAIIDIYNTFKPHPRGIAMQPTWAWCACTVSAVAIKLGYTSIMPVEISCLQLIALAKNMGIWVENDKYQPKPGDLILYDWQDSGAYAVLDNVGAPDHVGMVIATYPSAGYFVVMEGNYSDSVKRRTVSYNGRYIRGFITPKYEDNTVTPDPLNSGLSLSAVAHEVIAGKWKSGDERKTLLTQHGYDYAAVQREVNSILNGSAVAVSTPQDQNQPTERKVTATCGAQSFDKSLTGRYAVIASDGLNLRNDAGTNKKALAVIPNGTCVQCYGWYTTYAGAKWYYVEVALNRTLYTGFVHSDYLNRV